MIHENEIPNSIGRKSLRNLLQPKDIGTFLQHIIVAALGSEQDHITKSIIKNLSGLMTFNSKDLLTISKVLGMNDFRNVELLALYELENEKVNISDISKCYMGLTSQMDPQKKLEWMPRKYHPYSEPSPCNDLNNSPQCKIYCAWQKSVFEEWSTSELNVFQR